MEFHATRPRICGKFNFIKLNCPDLSVRLVSRYDVSLCRAVKVSGVKFANIQNNSIQSVLNSILSLTLVGCCLWLKHVLFLTASSVVVFLSSNHATSFSNTGY